MFWYGEASGLLILWTLVSLSRMTAAEGPPQSITIGGIFEDMYEGSKLAFQQAVEKINSRRDLLADIKLSYDITKCPPQDSFTADRQVCRQLKDGIAAVFGPMSYQSAAHVQSICDAMEIPHVETRWDYSDNKDFFSINLYPAYTKISEAYIDFISYSQWTSFIILYDSDDGLAKLQQVLKAPEGHPFKITVRKLQTNPDGPTDYRPLLKEIRNKGGCRIILDCDYTKVHTILHQALTINMATQYYHYLLTTLDADLVDLEDFMYIGVNITAFRLIDPTRPEVMEVVRDWRFQRKTSQTRQSPIESNMGYGFRTEAALMYDAVHLFAKAFDELSGASVIQTASLSCNKGNPWSEGSSLINYMKMTTTQGLSGLVKFDYKGRRMDFNLDVTELSKDGMQKIGTWDTDLGLRIIRDYERDKETTTIALKNRTMRVTTLLEDPYIMQKEDKSLKGNDRFEGYCVDLLLEISKILNFTYEIHLVGDGEYGAAQGENNDEWTGMVRELMDLKADLAVASLTISYVREQVIDFTKPFMNLGISILFKRPLKKNPSLFSFLTPLSFEIWVYVFAAYVLVSLLLFVLARFSPYEWYNPHPCNQDSDVVENQFTLMNSFWFTIGSLMQQGSEVAPRAMSTRLVSAIWWFFTLIIISSYTANLAAFLTVERMTSPIENADDLSKQTDIKYGTLWGGSTQTFFKSSSIPTYERMWNFMSSHKPTVFVNATKDGIDWVKEGNYAYLLESTMNEHITQRNCDLMQVGGLLDSKGYGIGTPRGSPYRDAISDAILKLAEDQKLQKLYNRWWKEKGGAGQCDVDDKNKKDASALAIANVGGVFVTLVAGLALSLIVGVLEFVYKSQKNADVDKVRQSVCSEMAEELRFAIKCTGSSTKPAKKRPRLPTPDMIDEKGMTLTVPLTSKYATNQYTSAKEYYT